MANPLSLTDLVLKLYDVQAIKFGEFVLKTGIKSPVYFDLRVIISYPDLMEQVSECLWKAAEQANAKYDSVCGVPYTALPLATVIAIKHNVPMLIRRKEAKDYGTKKMIEGHFRQGEACLIVEDVVTSGSSVLETVEALNGEGILVKDTVVLLDREQGGKDRLHNHKVNLHSVCSLSKLLTILQEAGKIDQDMVNQVNVFISENNTANMAISAPAKGDKTETEDTTGKGEKRKVEEERGGGDMNGEQKAKKKKVVVKKLRYGERVEQCSHHVVKNLLRIMEEKKTNLAFSADVTSSEQLLKLVEEIGPSICVLKTHIDIVEDFTPDLTDKLRTLAEKHNFLIFEDRKFADIGNTVKHQLCGGVYKISTWADIVNAHAIPGPGIIQGLKEACDPATCGCLLLAEMSSQGNLIQADYTQEVVRMAEQNKDFVMGFICRSQLSEDPNLIHMTPGVKLERGVDGLGQQYTTPEEAITQQGTDIIIVGRGILQAEDPAAMAKQYQEAGYAAYEALFK